MKFPHSLGPAFIRLSPILPGSRSDSRTPRNLRQTKSLDAILDKLIDIKEDSCLVEHGYFSVPLHLTMTGKAFEKLFSRPARKQERQRENNIAESVQPKRGDNQNSTRCATYR